MDAPDPPFSRSPLLVFLIIALTVFVAEICVMFLLPYLGDISQGRQALMDALLLVFMISPTLYLFLFRTMVFHIRKRVKMEELLRRNKEEQFKIVVRTSLDGFIMTNAHGRIVETNDAYCRMLGYERGELLRMNVTHIDTKLSPDEVLQRIGHHGDGVGSHFETTHLRRDGTLMEVEVSAQYNPDTGLVAAFLRDITDRKQMQQELLDNEERFRAMSENSGDAMIMMDQEGRVTFWNASAERIFGYRRDEVLGQDMHHFIAPSRHEEGFRRAHGSFLRTGSGPLIGKTMEIEALHRKGHEFPVELSLGAVKIKGHWHAIGVARDITERRAMKKVLEDNETRLREMFENLSSGVAVYRSTDGRDFFFTAFNHAAERIDGIFRKDVIGKNVVEVFPAIAQFGLLEVFRRVWTTGVAEHHPAGLYQDGRISSWRENYVYKLSNDEIVAIIDDVTASKLAEEKMHRMAHYDALTGLPNRPLFLDRLRLALVSAKRSKAPLAVMFGDLNRFKPVNDALGHDVGDALLKSVARRLKNSVRESDTVARVGGDEFVILLPAPGGGREMRKVADKVLESLRQPFDLSPHTVSISASIGLALYPEHGEDEAALIRNADLAMYVAKREGEDGGIAMAEGNAQT